MFLSKVLALVAAIPLAFSLPTIEVKGSKLFLSTGQQFFVKGVAYQLTPDDPLVNTEQCKLDATLMKELGVNAIRVYHVDPEARHDGCMQAFSDAGIYVWIDLDTFATYLNPTKPEWNRTLYNAYSRVMDVFHRFDNVAGFFVGNEVMNNGANSIVAPFVKAAARDMKTYRNYKGYRNIPIGYSASDITVLRPNLQNYFACGKDPMDRMEFFSLNAYEWCGASSFQTSGYSNLDQLASNYTIPIWFSETGCNAVRPRTFSDQAAILGPDMNDKWSGAMIYEWIEEANDYGLISYKASDNNKVVDGFARGGTPIPVSPDFENLKSQWATLTPTGVMKDAYTPSNSPPICPPYTTGAWEVSGDVVLPTIGVGRQAVPMMVTADVVTESVSVSKPVFTPDLSSHSYRISTPTLFETTERTRTGTATTSTTATARVTATATASAAQAIGFQTVAAAAMGSVAAIAVVFVVFL
ncbi:glycoside hydrolase family 72 protein [Piedraia hortae CBS 480.64]|uniref:1,3-beta-glucanosyltransferase n=1 Tax=Piedraia hortae CBS 480.64 TaxID=1314780 RepID=A0A6A7CBL6_9PEZI|nr:glycoside hydrolase family 72 protein [Piedraia hortae CBS 480.64]